MVVESRIVNDMKSHLSYAADNALTFAGGSVLGPAIGDSLIARASVIHASKNQAVCRCDVFISTEEGERMCATSQGTISRLGSPSDSKA